MRVIWVVLIYFFLAVIAFQKLPFTFFQQDEWAVFGNYIYWEKANLSWWERLFTYEQDTHLIPFANLLSYLEFKMFGLHFFYYGIFSIATHIANAILVYILSVLLTKKKSIGYLSGAIFLIGSITHQAVTWIATSPGTLTAAFFALLSAIFFIRSKVFFAAIFLIVSLGFKETSIFLLIFFPIVWYVQKRALKITAKRFLFSFGFLAILYVILRAFFALYGYESTSDTTAVSQPNPIVYAFRLPTVPFKFIAQSFVPQSVLTQMAGELVTLGYPQFVQGGKPNPYIVQSVAVDIISYLFSIGFFITFFVSFSMLKRKKEENIAKTILVSIAFVVLGSFPFVLVPGMAGYFSLIDGRHLYLTSAFFSLLISIVAYTLFSYTRFKRIVGPAIIISVSVFLVFHILQIRSHINQQVGIGLIRKGVLQQITGLYPKLPQKIVFFVESDKAYYGLPETQKIPPFQSGFGQTLLVWYHMQGEKFPSCFFKEKYLYTLLEEGYRECDGRGFGYFRNNEKLAEVFSSQNISQKDVIPLSYHSSDHSIKVDKNLINNLQ